jgi:hypothetical protein
MATQPLNDEPTADEMPDLYASVCQGTCLEPIFSDGECLVFDKRQEPQNGDFVGIWLHPDAVAPGEGIRRIKRLLMGGPPGMTYPLSFAPGSEVEPLVVLEQLNPPKRIHVRGCHVLAMHRVIGVAEPDGTGQAQIVRSVAGTRVLDFSDEA